MGGWNINEECYQDTAGDLSSGVNDASILCTVMSKAPTSYKTDAIHSFQ